LYGKLEKYIKRRSTVVLIIFIVLWAVIVGRLFGLQVIDHEKYQQSVTDQVQRMSTVSAERGDIVARSGEILATNLSVWRVFVSPVDIESKEQAQFICRNLAEILNVDYDTIYDRALRENRADETVKRNVEKADADRVLAFIEENDLKKQIHLEATTKRYYQYDSLAANVIGFTGTDGGSYGIELQYDSYLKGTPGRYITAKNGLGMDMPFKYESYIEAEDGYDVVLTIDMRIQQLLEKQLKKTYEDCESAGGAVGIVMDVNTGGILAMAQYPSYNLNTPGVLGEEFLKKLDAMNYVEDSDEYNKAYTDLLYSSWNNKSVSWLYEPGSTFKVITTSMAVEEDAVDLEHKFYCSGQTMVEGYSSPIRCHLWGGHGSLNLAKALQESCNPALIAISHAIGSNKFYDYYTSFGYTGRTGIDLRGEASGLYVPREKLNLVELSVYSFGQTFKTSPIQQITAISAVANGGYIVTPHILDKVVDSDGNIVKSFETEVKRQVISKETSKYISDVLEKGVSGGMGARNAYVLGYKVAAKTGTSQKRDILDKNLHIGSCIAYAPADDPQIAAIIIVDEPMGDTIYGSTIAAPYMSDLFEEVLPHIGLEKKLSPEEEKLLHTTLWDYTSLVRGSAISVARQQGVEYEFVGDGPTVVAQIPPVSSSVLASKGKIILFFGEATPENDVEKITVPDVTNYVASFALTTLTNKGFNISIEGALNYDQGAGAKVTTQDPPAGTLLPRGSVVTINVIHEGIND